MRTESLPLLLSLVLTVACSSASEGGGSTGGSGGSLPATGGTSHSGAASMGGATSSGGGALATSGGTSASGASSGGAPATSGGASPSGGASLSAGANSGGKLGTAGSSSAGGNASSGGGGAPSGGSGGGGATGCTRDLLQAATKNLANALTAKDSTKMSLASGATYTENLKASDFTKGIWQSAVKIALQRDILDVDQCHSFSEIIITEGTPYVLGVRLELDGSGKVSAAVALVSNSDDWQFDAANYLKVSKAEDWSPIPSDQRDTRDVLIAAADAYFNLFNDKTVTVPWNTPCTRLEGGKFTTGYTCDVGVPNGITFADKHWIVDRDLGVAVGMVRFGGANGIPDSHAFRMLKGKIRYVHTITICDGMCST